MQQDERELYSNVTVDFNRLPRRTILLSLIAINVALTVSSALFIYLYGRLQDFGPTTATLIKKVLAQFHLATENVLATWYSSMLLLMVALLAAIAFKLDQGRSRLRFGWLAFAAAFALLSLDEIGSFHESVGMLSNLFGASGARGWVYVLGIPILLGGLFVVAFGLIHVRAVPGAFWLLAAGAACFVANPVFEEIEMIMLGSDAPQGTWQMTVHNTLLVAEEGGLELMGILCFAAGVFTYVFTVSRGVVRLQLPDALSAVTAAVVCVWLAALFGTEYLITLMPRGDEGIPQHWFPAAAMFCTALIAATATSSTRTLQTRALLISLAVAALCLSGWFGAGLHRYEDWKGWEWSRQLLIIAMTLGYSGALIGVAAYDRRVGKIAAIFAGFAAALAINAPGEHAVIAGVIGAWTASAAVARCMAPEITASEVAHLKFGIA